MLLKLCKHHCLSLNKTVYIKKNKDNNTEWHSCGFSMVCMVLQTVPNRFAEADRLDGPVVRRSPPERKIPGSNPACAGNFSGSSHTSDFKIGTPVATLPGAWRCRVSTGTGRPGFSIL